MEGISLTSLTFRDFRGEAEKNRDPTGLAQRRREEQAKSWVAKKACDQLGYFATTEKELIRMQERSRKKRRKELLKVMLESKERRKRGKGLIYNF